MSTIPVTGSVTDWHNAVFISRSASATSPSATSEENLHRKSFFFSLKKNIEIKKTKKKPHSCEGFGNANQGFQLTGRSGNSLSATTKLTEFYKIYYYHYGYCYY
jgi:hypothetical protein